MARPRGIISGWLDWGVSWLLGLPSECSAYTTEMVSIPLKDGTILQADFYKPTGIEPLGTILVQCPYGRGFFMTIGNVHTFAPRGYQVLFVSCRGTFGSTGDFNGGKTQLADGQEIVAWMRQQSWYTGSFATVGASYLGFAQWALLRDPPEDMVAAVILVGPHDHGKISWGSGSFSLLQRLKWSELIMKQETASFMERLKMMKNETIAPLIDAVPLQPQIDTFFGDKAPWLNHSLDHPDINDASWLQLRHAEALEKVNIPILLVTAWHDLFLDQTMDQYQRLHERQCNVALTIAPGGHMDIGTVKITGDTFEWIERYLANKQHIERKAPVSVFVGGSAQNWIELQHWPPSNVPLQFYLGPDGSLNKDLHSEDAKSSFTFDPKVPTPTLGGPLLNRGGGTVDDTALATRSDTLVFTTEPLKEPLKIIGEPIVNLEHSTDRPYADLFVRISEVRANAKSYNITEKFVRLPENRTSQSVTVKMRPTAYEFAAGNRIQLLIAGGSHPQFARNYGSGEPLTTGTTLYSVEHTVFHGGQAISSLVLPSSLVSSRE